MMPFISSWCLFSKRMCALCLLSDDRDRALPVGVLRRSSAGRRVVVPAARTLAGTRVRTVLVRLGRVGPGIAQHINVPRHELEVQHRRTGLLEVRGCLDRRRVRVVVVAKELLEDALDPVRASRGLKEKVDGHHAAHAGARARNGRIAGLQGLPQRDPEGVGLGGEPQLEVQLEHQGRGSRRTGLEPRLLLPEGVLLVLQLPERPLQLPERIRPLRKRLREVDLECVPLPRAIPARKRLKLGEIDRGVKVLERREGPVERDLGLHSGYLGLGLRDIRLGRGNLGLDGPTGAVVGATTGRPRRRRGGHRRKKKKDEEKRNKKEREMKRKKKKKKKKKKKNTKWCEKKSKWLKLVKKRSKTAQNCEKLHKKYQKYTKWPQNGSNW
eukprot:TRINITY_DN4654_c0_g1_i1.p1 TRINITY_DN4654_c0_g1~~TRINITY_DN4654_c0_g1_i1.p1  ORF type:complete len:383 (-),score=95.03 TRINITY_DN4654_c0_g1_i1:37-1185(-)